MFNLFPKKYPSQRTVDSSRRHGSSQEDFIPYFHHYDRQTISTKNGELLQIIQITQNLRGLNYEDGLSADQTLRHVLRKALSKSVDSEHFAFWTHTIRRRVPITYESEQQLAFARYVNEAWKKEAHQDYQYYNEVYLTVLREGYTCDLLDGKELQHTVLPTGNRLLRKRQLAKIHTELVQVTQKIVAHLGTQYNAHILGIDERIPESSEYGTDKPIFFSGGMEFLGHVLNLSPAAYPLPELDIAQSLNQHGLTFGYNALESRGSDGHKRFAAVLTIKHYHETALHVLDHVLQSSTQMIICQSWTFLPPKEAAKYYKPQKELFDISGDIQSIKTTGLDIRSPTKNARDTDYVREQTNVIIIVDDYRQLDDEVAKIQGMFGDIGISTIREDILMEDIFWSCLPGNFEFLRRREIAPAAEVASFARLNRFASGTATGNHWDDALTVLPTTVGSPYFFNFHVQDRGHTLLMDYNSFHDSAARALTNFLLVQATKWQGRTVIFDTRSSAELTVSKLEGMYHHAQPDAPLMINPFALEDTPRNQSFLLAWINELLEGRLLIHENERGFCREAIARLYTHPSHERSADLLVKLLETLHPSLARSITTALSSIASCRFGLRDVELHPNLTAFSMDGLFKTPQQATAIFAYLLHQTINQLDGRPTIIVVHDAIALFENPFFASRLETLMQMLTQHNALLLLTVTNPQQYSQTHTLKLMIEQTATRLYVPDEIQQDYTDSMLGLSEQDNHLLNRMRRETGQFLMKQQHDVVGLNLNPTTMPDIRAILAGDIKHLIAAGGAFAAPTARRA